MTRLAIALLALAAAAPLSAATIEITNGTGNWSIYYVYISPSTSDSWGDDWLGSDVMSPGETWEFDVTNGSYDIRLVDEDGDDYILYNIPVSGYYSWYVTLDDLGEHNYGGSTGEYNYGSAPVTINNELGSYTIYYIYCSPSSSSDWGEDWLGSEVLSPGESFTFYVTPNDYYDIQCVDEDDDTYTLMEVWVDDAGFSWDVDLGDLD